MKRSEIEAVVEKWIEDNTGELELTDYINIEEIVNDFEESGVTVAKENILDTLTQAINEQEIIYYSNAIDYLSKNDASLNESMNIANDLGYEASNINSELLATLLYQQNLQADLWDIIEELENVLSECE